MTKRKAKAKDETLDDIEPNKAVTVDLEEDDKPTKKEDETVEEEGAEVEGSDPTPEEVIESLKTKLKKSEEETTTARANQAAAEKVSQESTSRAVTSEAEYVRTQEVALDNAVVAATGEVDKIQADLERALEEGDNKAIAKAQRDLGKANYDLGKMEDDKAAFTQWKEQREAAIKAAPKKTDSPYSPAAQQWIGDHPKFNTDPIYRNIALGAHEMAKDKGIQIDSPAYFKFLEDKIGHHYGEEDEAPGKTETRQRPAASSTAAPSSRDTGTTTTANPKKVTLSPEEVAAAKDMGVSVQEYAKAKLALKNEGRLGMYNRKVG